MNKKELIGNIASKSGLSKKDAESALSAFTNVVADALADGEKVSIVGFGNFSVTERAARTGRNPHDGTTIDIPASKAPKFKASTTLKDAVKGKK